MPNMPVVDPPQIEAEFREKACASLRIMRQGEARFRVLTPFMFTDGDLLSVVLKYDRVLNAWAFSDGATTFMRLSYSMDDQALRTPTRQRIIADAIESFGIENRDGELLKPVAHEEYSDTLFTFIQALLRIADVAQLTRETVRRAFVEDVAELIEKVVPPEKRIQNWHDPTRDPNASYRADWRLEGKEAPVFVFALGTQGRVKDATITLLQYERWGMKGESVGIFEDEQAIPVRDIARFGDVATKTYSSLRGNGDRVADYLRKHLEGVEYLR